MADITNQIGEHEEVEERSAMSDQRRPPEGAAVPAHRDAAPQSPAAFK